MSRRRVVSMLTASAAVLALGYVVAVASRSLPGATEGAPLFDLDFRSDLDLGPLLAWALIALAVLGVVLFALALGQGQSRVSGRRRSLLGAVLGLLVLFAIVRWLWPAAETLFGEGAATGEPATEVLGEERRGAAGGWLLGILLAAVLAAALTRIGLSIKTTPAVFGPVADERVTVLPAGTGTAPVPRGLGDDPRSRVIAAYERFERELAALGRPRHESETTARHAWRASRELDLSPVDVGELVRHHALARYGAAPPTESDAAAAEGSAQRLTLGLGG
ncbi:MAG TPA: DUF4129 domain-containing protein [Acidimicrobiia bacterium]|nr:DUF4129 domain-containing protein [Acidimicrobiia bacterium]